jgi:branched chain amino acid efflux pump
VTWTAVVLTCAGCYLLKLGGRLVPPHWLQSERTAAVVNLLPIALLTSLVVTQTFATRTSLTLDARAAGVAAAGVALLLRAPLAVALASAIAVTALVRALPG